MAESIITDAVSTILEKLGSRAYKNLMFAKDLDSHIERLQELKSTVEATLRDAAFLESCSDAQRDVFNKLRCAIDDLDDFLDDQTYKSEHKEVMRGNKFINKVRLFFSESNQLVSALRDSHKLKAIIEKFDYIARNHANFGSIVSHPSVTQNEGWRVQMASSPIFCNSMVVGRDRDRDNIVSMLSEDSMASETLSVNSIVGIGGMGKTTLACCVYNDERVKQCFDVQFWVSATQKFDHVEVLGKIIVSAFGTEELKRLNCEMGGLFHCVHRAIGGKKFLLVLDNVWDQSDLRNEWMKLKGVLSLGANGSKVLVTTRNQRVAGVMESVDPYTLGYLTEDDCWLLFRKFAFTKWQEAGVEAIGEEIAKMCPKVPLVISSIGGLLAGKRTVQEWQAFRDDQLANFASYGRDIMVTLKLSYDHLDERLKPCVTYCTLFPRGFKKEDMIRRWIALGYIEPQYKNQSLEEAGEEHVMSLLNCGFFQAFSDVGYGSKIKMHDVMYELVLSLAGFKHKEADSNTKEIDKRVRHLSLNLVGSFWNVPSSLFKTKHLQSFIVRSEYRVRNMSIDGKLLSNLQCLRVLELRKLGMVKLPTSLGQLINLRYLDLSYNYIEKLPNSITRLVNLQSLNLIDCNFLKELPKDMSKLVNLRHLLLDCCYRLSHMPKGFGNLTNLRTLDVFVVSEQIDSQANIVGKLSDLNQLSIKVQNSKNIVPCEISGVNLKMKEKLKKLIISFSRKEDGMMRKEDETVLEALQPPSNLLVLEIRGYMGERLPGWMMDQLEIHLPHLRDIRLIDCKSCRNLCSFGRLPHLTHLELKGLDEVEYMEDGINSSNAPLFPSLVKLTVTGTPKLKGWWRMGPTESRGLNIVTCKPAFPGLKNLNADRVELAIAIAGQHFGGFPTLHNLHIKENIGQPRQQQQQALILLNCCFPKLRDLTFSSQDEAEVLSEAIRDLSSLAKLSILHCKQLKPIPEWIDSLTNLEMLHIEGCPRMESLPQQITNLTNLKYLSICYCPRMESLPQQIANLTKLDTLYIIGCSILMKRCEKPNGEYWPYIQHIPKIY